MSFTRLEESIYSTMCIEAFPGWFQGEGLAVIYKDSTSKHKGGGG